MFEGRLAQANGRLKAAKVGVSIEAIGDRLYLRATFPPRPGTKQRENQQQRIALGCHTTVAGLQRAEKEARKVGALLDCGEFDWSVYVKTEAKNNVQTVADWVSRYERDYFTRRQRNPKSETTWKDDYLKVFKTLPQDEALTLEMMRTAITATTPDTRTRKRFCTSLRLLAEFAGLADNFKSLQGKYSAQMTEVREVPSDALVAAWYEQIPHAAWQWAYGMMATYGLRNHELFYLDFSKMPVLIVLDGSKTDFHRVYPLYPEWVERWQLTEAKIPQCSGKNNSALGNRVTHAFKRYKIPFHPYDLRHGWAVRSLEFGMPVELAAQQMGHSVDVHCKTYHRWISEEVHDRAYRLLMERGDRPKAP